ncbi:MAG: hypothetical protein AAFQ40_06485 [Cyanobacteria bacterium J06623_5]
MLASLVSPDEVAMQTQLVMLQVSVRSPHGKPTSALPKPALMRSDELRSHIEAELAAYGAPLRWAITRVDEATQTAYVEAVVTSIS